MKTVPRVMMIDDDDLNNYITTKIIEHAGLAKEVDCYVAAEKALQVLTENSLIDEGISPDIILLDISMYKMDGWQFLYQYEQLNENYSKKIHLFILTTSIMEADMIKAQKLKHVEGFYHKPLTMPIIDDIRKKVFASKGKLLDGIMMLFNISF